MIRLGIYLVHGISRKLDGSEEREVGFIQLTKPEAQKIHMTPITVKPHLVDHRNKGI